jgi:chaperonin GroES
MIRVLNKISEEFIMIKPLYDRVVLEVTKEEEKTVGGIVLTSAAKERPQTAKVVAVGGGLVLDNGEVRPMQVNVGDVVIFEKFAGVEVKVDGADYLIVRENDILGVLN